jgi:hypothetical protein
VNVFVRESHRLRLRRGANTQQIWSNADDDDDDDGDDDDDMMMMMM